MAAASSYGCESEGDDPVDMMVLANTVPGHGDVPVADSYRGISKDYYQAALESLQGGRFVVAWIDGSDDHYVKFRRYDVGLGGFMEEYPIILDSDVRNLERAGFGLAKEGAVQQGVAWLVWDFHPNPDTWTVNWARVRNDGTYDIERHFALDAAGAAGAKGNTGIPWPPGPEEPRILIVYVSGDIWPGEPIVGVLPCGKNLEAMLYHPDGTPLAGPITMDSTDYPYCFSGPSVVFNAYATRFEVLYQYRNREAAMLGVIWRALWVTPEGEPESTPHAIVTPTCSAWGAKSAEGPGILSSEECHRHMLAFDPSPTRNGTHRFAVATYGRIYLYNQDWSFALEIQEFEGWPFTSVIDRAQAGVVYSYQSFKHESSGTNELRHPKFYDNSTGYFDADVIGGSPPHPCSNPGWSRGYCYYNEGMAISGSYTAALYGDQSGDTEYPLFLSILNAN